MHKALLDYDINSDFENCWYILPYIHKSPVKIFYTVPDVTYVIDFCRLKELVTDPDTNLSRPKAGYHRRRQSVIIVLAILTRHSAKEMALL
ncbi:hypothetical protein OUZ56_024584 [Daphnia magna]|uniref:Uncharacterized protein n=1 Tax=Daphnia magna TaxID=35525 RepID=A0ABR0B108_9CRUS|nr:hypothetical protein OUZ56_024584 [Daphnia magna]